MEQQPDNPLPMSLDYATPTAPPRRSWGAGSRVALGSGLSFVMLFVQAALADAFSGEWMLLPMSAVAIWVHNRNTTGTHVMLANGIFWGFAIAMCVGRKWRTRSRQTADFFADRAKTGR